MATFYESIPPKLQDFIKKQHIFFVATAAKDGRVNLSPKGLDSLRILDQNRIIWLNLTGSGNETAAHLLDSNRMTIMMCSFEKNPLILRLYGKAKTIHKDAADWDKLYAHFPPHPGARQIFDMQVESVQTSCGYAVPFFDFKGDRTVLSDWADRKGEEGIKQYQQEKNRISIDGKPTGL